jgi:hypothetical protein
MSDVKEFNEQLLLVLRAGVPLAVGDLSTRGQVEKLVAQVQDRISSSGSLPAPINEGIGQEGQIHSDYREALIARQMGESTVQSMQMFFECGQSRSESRWSITKILLPLLLVMWLVVQGMMFLVGQLYPEMVDMYQISRLEPSASLQFLGALNEYSRIGSMGATLLMGLIIVLWLRVPNWIISNFPIHRFTMRTLRHAQQLERHARRNRQLLASQSTVSPSNQSIAQADGEIRSLEIRAAACRESSSLMTRKWLRWFPLLAGTFLSGLLVFGYVFCLFWPLTDLLHQLSKP